MDIEEIAARLRTAEGSIAELMRLLTEGGGGPDGAPALDVTPEGVAIGRGGLVVDYRGSASCPYGRSATQRRKPFEAIIVHHTGMAHDTEWYVQYQIDGDPARGGHFGYHFYIAPDGRILQGAPLTKRTNHVKPSGHAKRNDFGRHANNSNAIGIACARAGTPAFRPTSAQVAALERLTSALATHYGIGFDRVYGHGEIQSDRHATEGRSAAETIRGWTATRAPALPLAGALPDDDTDDAAVHEIDEPAGMTPYGAMPGGDAWQVALGLPAEDADDDTDDAIVWTSEPEAAPLGAAGHGTVAAAQQTELRYTNQNATRNRRCTANIEARLVQAVDAVFGPGCSINIYSGGQVRLGQGMRRTGSIRHDDYGAGGRAADVHVFDQSGHQIRGLDLARLGQYWLAAGFGCVGHEMRGGGIHLDEWTTSTPGGGRFWTYAASDAQPWGAQARALLARGAQGTHP
jgi:hypothetical protein